jgi:predicted  nucleic acid-binding Zn-ribbon protein
MNIQTFLLESWPALLSGLGTGLSVYIKLKIDMATQQKDIQGLKERQKEHEQVHARIEQEAKAVKEQYTATLGEIREMLAGYKETIKHINESLTRINDKIFS